MAFSDSLGLDYLGEQVVRLLLIAGWLSFHQIKLASLA
ncbi:hypothetical protein CU024_2754 [Enterococcus faecium]|nr:hypothetical protein [Enterococcus faecium]MBK4788984.1 hypothetical protein [Enterococcus faecium]MBK4841339.1 hypothetical protein [Enterococcus faecium]MBK4876348.1 hypothetical protein [Enterococcus faecium]